MTYRFGFPLFCHPEPGPEPCPETSSGSNEFRIYDFGISVLDLEFAFKAPPCGRGSLLPIFSIYIG
jgi:hypothetical protein